MISLDFPFDKELHFENDKHTILKFVSLSNVLSDVGGFAKSVTTIFTLIFGWYIYELFIKDLALLIKSNQTQNYMESTQESNLGDKKENEYVIESIKDRLCFYKIYSLFDRVENIYKETIQSIDRAPKDDMNLDINLKIHGVTDPSSNSNIDDIYMQL